jgi:hypothetical protein
MIGRQHYWKASTEIRKKERKKEYLFFFHIAHNNLTIIMTGTRYENNFEYQ